MAFNEMPGYPIEEWNRDGGRVTRKWVGPWTERHTFSIPSTWGTTALYKDTVLILGHGRGSVVSGDSVYPDATIEVTYTPLRGGSALAVSKGLSTSWEFNFSSSVEHYALKGNLCWGSDGKPTGRQVQRIQCLGEIVLTRRNATSVPESVVNTCRGKINSDTFLGYAPGKLLFLGLQTRGVVSDTGVEGLSYTLKFAIHEYDWRYAWREDKGKGDWDYIYVQDSSPTKYVYEAATFAGLIA